MPRYKVRSNQRVYFNFERVILQLEFLVKNRLRFLGGVGKCLLCVSNYLNVKGLWNPSLTCGRIEANKGSKTKAIPVRDFIKLLQFSTHSTAARLDRAMRFHMLRSAVSGGSRNFRKQGPRANSSPRRILASKN